MLLFECNACVEGEVGLVGGCVGAGGVYGEVFAHFETFVCGGGAVGDGVGPEGGVVCVRGGGDREEVVGACVWWGWALLKCVLV